MKKNGLIKSICLLCVLCVALSAFGMTVSAAANTKWGVKQKSFGTCYITTGNVGRGETFSAVAGGALAGAKGDEPKGIYGKGDTDSAMHFELNKILSAGDDGTNVYNVCIGQPGATGGAVPADGTMYVYYNFALAFQTLPGEGTMFFGYTKNDDSDNTTGRKIHPLMTNVSCFTEAGRWYNVGVVIAATATSCTGSLYVDGVEVVSAGATVADTLTSIDRLGISFQNTDPAATGTHNFYIDDVYVEYGTNAPTVVGDTGFYPASDGDFTFQQNKIVAHRAGTTVADFYAKLTDAQLTTSKYAVRDSAGTTYAADSTEPIEGKYVAYSGTTYGKSGTEVIPLVTFTAPVQLVEKMNIEKITALLEGGNEDVVTDSVPIIAQSLRLEFTKNIGVVNSVKINEADIVYTVTGKNMEFAMPAGAALGDVLHLSISLEDATEGTLVITRSLTVTDARVTVSAFAGAVNQTGTECTLTVELNNVNPQARPVSLFAIHYTADGRCVQVGRADVSAATGTGTHTVTVATENKQTGDYVQLLMWDSVDFESGLHPVLLLKDGLDKKIDL